MNTTPRPTRAPAPPAETMTADRVEDASFHEVERPNSLPAAHQQRASAPAAPDQSRQEREYVPLPKTGFAALAAGIAGVMAEIRPVEKSGWNDFHKYNYARMQDLMTELTPLMGKHGIVVFQNELDRDMFDEGRAMAVRYEFTIVHRSGEIWPERPIITGVSMCRTSNGKYDDKAFNKCHTSARKYFLLSLFQIPTDDAEDADGDGGDNGQQRPRPQGQPRRQVPGPDGKIGPHRIAIIDGESPASWAARYGEFVSKAKTKAEIDKWYDFNSPIFEKLKSAHEQVYNDAIDFMDACESKLAKADPISSGKPAETEKAAADFPGDKQQPARRASPPSKEIDTSIPFMLDAKLTDPEKDWLKSVDEAFAECGDTESLAAEQDSVMWPNKDHVSERAWEHAKAITAKHLGRVQGQ